jgi:hypothetical protein
LLVTCHRISKISRYDDDMWGEFWRFTSRSLMLLFEEVFLPENIEIKAYGNVLAAISFLHGISATELKVSELHFHDLDYEVPIALRGKKNAK